MKKLLLTLVFALAPLAGFAAGGAGPVLEHANIDLTDEAAIQRGAKIFVNYCQGCHTAKYFRYERMEDFGLTLDEIEENLIFSGAKIGSHMLNSMPDADAAAWFGAAPPDLTLVSRLKHNGADWLYSYFKGFYSDPSRPMGVNNTVFPNVGMPNVLWELQGVQEAATKEDEHGNKVVESLSMVKPGQLSAEEFDGVARDLTTFLVHVGEPMQLERKRIGWYVMIFLLIFFVLAYMLKKEFWKDIH